MWYLQEDKRVWDRELIASQIASRILGIGLFVILTSLGAFVRIPLPFTPVPITLQTFFVLLSGLFLKKYDGSISQAIYIILGLIGLPIFAANSGAKALLGPTGGYLVGFILAPFLVNLIYNSIKISSLQIKAIIALIGGAFVIHLLGVANLVSLLKVNLTHAIGLGSVPFLPGDALKIILGTQLFLLYKKGLQKM